MLCGEAVDLQRRVGSVATEPHRVIPAVTDAPLLNADSVVHHAHVVDREHAPVDLTQTRAQSRRGCLRPARRSDFFLFKHRRQRAEATYMLVKSLQCSRIRILRFFFRFQKNVNFYVSWNDASKRHKKSLAKVQSSVLRNEFTYFAQRSL